MGKGGGGEVGKGGGGEEGKGEGGKRGRGEEGKRGRGRGEGGRGEGGKGEGGRGEGGRGKGSHGFTFCTVWPLEFPFAPPSSQMKLDFLSLTLKSGFTTSTLQMPEFHTACKTHLKPRFQVDSVKSC